MTASLPPREPVLRALIDACGPDFARSARSTDAIAGHQASFVAVPATVGALSEVLRLAQSRGLEVHARGSGSKIDWGTPPAGVDLIIDTGRLGGMWNHRPDEFVAEVGAGTPVAALQAALALQGQRLATDPPSPSATVGGMLAVNESGPLRHRFGTPSSQVTHISYVDGAGNPARSDGEHGSPAIADIDGVLTSAGVRLEQLPEARRWIAVPVSTPLQVYNLVEETLAQDLNPAAIEVDLPTPTVPRTTERPPGSLAILLEGGRTEIAVRAAELAKTIGDTSMVAEFAPRWWGRYPFTRADVALRISVAIEHLHAAVYALSDAAGRPVPIRGSAGIGTVHAVLPGTLPPERVEAILEAVRHVLLARGGHAVIIAAPPHIAAEVDMAGRRDLF